METHEHIRLTRRKMIVALGWLILLPLAGLWEHMIRRKQSREEGRSLRILLRDIPQGSSYYSDYWINRNSDRIEVYSTKCPHLGCRIKPASDGQLICPCHGSAFDQENGNVIKGPAGKDLEIFDYIIEDDHLNIYLE
jgi:Rieske Fe-S protein